VKLLLGLPMFEWTLISIDGTAQPAAALAARAAATGQADAAQLAGMLEREWNTLWIILTLVVAQTVLGVWRPRWRRHRFARAA